MEIKNEIKCRLNEYVTGNDYTPLKVELEVKPPIYITSPWLNLDSIIQYLCTRDALGDLFYCLPTHETIDVSLLDLPLKKTEDVYHASVGVYDTISQLKMNTIYKRFTDKETYHLTKRHQRGRIKTNQGHFKDFMINLPALITNKIIFYCNGDKKELERLLYHLTGVGKKTSITSGNVQKIHITETLEDYSFFKDGEIMRTLPLTLKIPLFEGATIQRQPYKPPYWNKDNISMCYVPESQVKL